MQQVIKTWDGDIYFIDGYETASDLDKALSVLDKAEMPNGDIIKVSAISKIQSLDAYHMQCEQKQRHKKGQYVKGGYWKEAMHGNIAPVDFSSITGKIENMKIENSSPQKKMLKKG